MRPPIAAALFVLAGIVSAGCEQPQPTAPSVTASLLAAPTTTPFSVSGTLAITDPGTQWVSEDGIGHIRDQTQSGLVSGDVTGSITVTGKSNVEVATETGSGSGRFTLTTSDGTWEGSFHGTFAAGVFSGKLMARGSGVWEGMRLKASVSQTAADRFYMLTGTIR